MNQIRFISPLNYRIQYIKKSQNRCENFFIANNQDYGN